jgi:alpha-beta hydrolase superfamily lysophospholipase
LKPDRFQFTSGDGLTIACVKWSGEHEVRGVVQIAHGLGEHIGRYTALADILVQAHFVVYGNDHRGHGLTVKPSGSFGDFGPGGFDQLVEDMVSLRIIAKEEHPGKPYILLAHSMGSFAAQQFVLEHSHSIDGLALSGSGVLDGLARLVQSIPAGADPMKFLNAAFEPARLKIPTIGIGAGPHCDGQVLVSYDVLGLFDTFVPRFAKQYAQVGEQILNAVSHYSEDVRQGVFPPSSSVRHDRAPVLKIATTV